MNFDKSRARRWAQFVGLLAGGAVVMVVTRSLGSGTATAGGVSVLVLSAGIAAVVAYAVVGLLAPLVTRIRK